MSCSSNKRRFRNVSAVVLAAWRAECYGQPCTFYQCPECQGFHLTKTRPHRHGGVLNRAATRFK